MVYELFRIKIIVAAAAVLCLSQALSSQSRAGAEGTEVAIGQASWVAADQSACSSVCDLRNKYPVAATENDNLRQYVCSAEVAVSRFVPGTNTTTQDENNFCITRNNVKKGQFMCLCSEISADKQLQNIQPITGSPIK